MRLAQYNIGFELKKLMLDEKRQQKIKTQKQAKTSPFEILHKESSNMPRLVWAEESETGLGFEIETNHDDVPTTSHCATYGQSSCTSAPKLALLFFPLKTCPRLLNMQNISKTTSQRSTNV